MKPLISVASQTPHFSSTSLSKVMNLEAFQPELIVVKAPKMCESMCVCKIKYNGEAFDIKLCGVRVLKVKRPDAKDMYIHVKPSKADIKYISRLEKALVKIATENTQDWFGHRMKPSLVDEYFTSNIALDDKYGNTFKCRLEDPYDDIKPSETVVDVILRVSCLRFHKQSFGIGYKIIEVSSPESAFLIDEDEPDYDTDENENEEDEESIGPDASEILSLADDLIKQSEAMIDELSSSIFELKEAVELVNTNRVSLKNVTSLHEILGKVAEKYFVTYK